MKHLSLPRIIAGLLLVIFGLLVLHAPLTVWLTATRDAIAACECRDGCPSCVQSPKCGNGNDPLHKAGSALLLRATLATDQVDGERSHHGVGGLTAS